LGKDPFFDQQSFLDQLSEDKDQIGLNERQRFPDLIVYKVESYEYLFGYFNIKYGEMDYFGVWKKKE
jgi:hypothetical protein